MHRTTIGIALVTLVAVTSFFTSQATGEDKAMERVYELRTYTTLPGRLDALNKRFRDHTVKLFAKHGMKNEMYWVPTNKENTLIYIVSHDSEEAAKKSWDGFRADPEWIKARDASEADGKIVEKVESVMMKTIDYSPIKAFPKQ